MIMKWTPLHTRIISHRIGDGTVNFYKRYIKATSENAKRLEETRKNEEKWKENLLEFSKLNGYVTIPIAKRFLNLSTDRAYRVLSILKKDKKLKVKFEGNKSRFVPTN